MSKKSWAIVISMACAFAGCIGTSRNSQVDDNPLLRQGLTLSLTQPTNTFLMSKPILIETHLENTTAQPIEINPFCPELGDWRKPIGPSKWLFAQTRVHIKRVSEVTGRLTELSSEYMVRDLEPFTLGPHDRKRFVFDLKTAGNIYAEGDLMAGPGEYKVWIEYWSATHSYDDDNSYEYEVKSNKITVNIADE